MTAGERAGKEIDLKLARMRADCLESAINVRIESICTAYKTCLQSRAAQDIAKYQDKVAELSELRKLYVDAKTEVDSLSKELEPSERLA